MSLKDRVLSYLGLAEEKVVEEEELLEQSEEEFPQVRKVKGNNVISLHHAKASVKVVLSEPRSYNEVQEIADHLRGRKSVIINLHRVRPEHARRIIDFLSGVVYALNGDIQKLGNDIFICAPENVDIQGTISEWPVQGDPDC